MLLVRAAEDERRHSNRLPYLSCRRPARATTRDPPPPPECQDEMLPNPGQELMAELLSSWMDGKDYTSLCIDHGPLAGGISATRGWTTRIYLQS